MAISPARLAANRRNSTRSTGPRSVAGRAASSQNATCHGLLSRRPLLADENPAEYELVSTRLLEALAPASAMEEIIVDDIVGAVWRLRRLQRVETALYTVGSSAPVLEALRRCGETDAAVGVAFSSQAASFAVLSRYEVALAGRLRRSLADLERLQAARESDDADIVVIPRACDGGFVS
jgi:hypothetical protein